MELTRRDALAALASAGIVGGGGAAFLASGDNNPNASFDDATDTLIAVAEVLYPTSVTGIRPFVETYSRGRIENRPDYREQLQRAASELDKTAQSWYDKPVADLERETRIALLSEMGIPEADPSGDPNATTARRLRYYIWNELQYALYTTPTGGRLVGIENPQGHPGGLTYSQHP